MNKPEEENPGTPDNCDANNKLLEAIGQALMASGHKWSNTRIGCSAFLDWQSVRPPATSISL